MNIFNFYAGLFSSLPRTSTLSRRPITFPASFPSHALPFTRRSCKPVGLSPGIVPTISNQLLLFSASHPCFPVRLSFPLNCDSHTSLFSGRSYTPIGLSLEIVPAISNFLLLFSAFHPCFLIRLPFP